MWVEKSYFWEILQFEMFTEKNLIFCPQNGDLELRLFVVYLYEIFI